MDENDVVKIVKRVIQPLEEKLDRFRYYPILAGETQVAAATVAKEAKEVLLLLGKTNHMYSEMIDCQKKLSDKINLLDELHNSIG